MKQLILPKGEICLIDNEDFHRCKQFNWYLNGRYVKRTSYNPKQVVFLHRFILNEPPYKVDHKDGDRLNNQKENLRKATTTQNNQNCRKRKNTTSRFKGVSWMLKNQIYIAQIQVNGRKIYIGSFYNEIEAALRYNEMAKLHFGEFAVLNNIKEI